MSHPLILLSTEPVNITFYKGNSRIRIYQCEPGIEKLEDLKVLKRSPDLLNNVKIGQGQT